MLCRVLVGLGEASYAVLSPPWIADLFPAGRRNNALTIFYVATPVGSALGYLLGGLALSHGGWRTGFFWAGAPGLILALCPSPAPRAAARRRTGPVIAAAAAATPGLADF